MASIEYSVQSAELGAKTWHHVQIASHRDDKGNVSYDWVNLDGAHSEFVNATVNSAEALGWQKGTLLINFQLDGANKDERHDYGLCP